VTQTQHLQDLADHADLPWWTAVGETLATPGPVTDYEQPTLHKHTSEDFANDQNFLQQIPINSTLICRIYIRIYSFCSKIYIYSTKRCCHSSFSSQRFPSKLNSSTPMLSSQPLNILGLTADSVHSIFNKFSTE